MENSVSQLKALYGYSDKVYKLLLDLLRFLEKKVEEIKSSDDSDEVNKFLKQLEKDELEKIVLYIKGKIDTINTPVRVQKKGFEKIFNNKIDELVDILTYVERNLQGIVKKIEKFQTDIVSKRSGFEPFKSYILDYKKDIHSNLELAVNRVLQDKLNYFHEELKKIENLETASKIYAFIKLFETNINTFIREQLLENVAGIMFSLKDTMYKRAEEYLELIDLPSDRKEKVLEEIKIFLDNYDNIYPVIYFDLPELPKDFFDYKGEYQSRMDIFVENIMSARFFIIFISGIVLSLIGLLELYITDADMFYVVLFLGMLVVIFALADAYFFNHSFLQNFLQNRKEFIIQLLENKLKEIKTNSYIFLIEQEEALENTIEGIINEELEVYAKGGKYLDDMKNNIQQFIQSIDNLKDELERAKLPV